MESSDSSVSIEGGRTLNTQKLKERILPNLPYLFIFWLMDKMGEAYRLSDAVNHFSRIIDAINGLAKLGENPFPSLHPFDMLVGVVGVIAIWLIVFLKKKDAKKYRKGVEYGSARWGTSEDIKPYIDPDFSKNILLTQTERIMVGRNKQPKYNINKNVLVIGGSGSGKTRFHIKPNLMQMNASFIVTDPKGTVIEECGKMLVEGGYKIRVLNLIDFSQSMKYNPFRYLHSENDILKLVNCIMENTKGEGTSGGEDFWQKAEALYYQALIAYIWYEARPEEKNMNTLLAMLNASEVREEDETFENAVDKLFRELEQKNPGHFAVRQYKKYKLAAGYEYWAKVFNLKEAARTLNFLTEAGISDYTQLEQREAEVSTRFQEISGRMKRLEGRMAEVADLKYHIIRYIKTREIYQKYRQAKDKAAFYREHAEEIAQHEAAKKAFDAFPGEKLPTVSELQSEYRKLLNEKKGLGEEFVKLRKEMQSYRDAKKNVDQILQVGDEKREKMKDKIER